MFGGPSTSSVPELGPGVGTNWGWGAGPQNGVVPACPVLWCRRERGCKTPGKCGTRFCLLGCPIPCIPPHNPAPLQPKFLSPNLCPAAPYPEPPVPASRSPVSPHPAAPAGHILLPVAPHPAAPSTHILLPVFPHPASYARVPRILQPRIPVSCISPAACSHIPQPRCSASYNTKSHRLLALRPAALGPTARHPCIPWSHILRGCLPQTSQPTSRSSPSLQPYILSLHPAVLSPSSLSPVLPLIPLPRLLAACTPQPRTLASYIPTPRTLQPASPTPYSCIPLPHTPAIHSQLRVPVSCSPTLLQLMPPAP